MADGIVVTGNVLSDIPTQCTGPQPGTQCNAGDVNSPLGTSMDGLKTIRDGSPTVSGSWTYSGTSVPGLPAISAQAGSGNAPAIIADGSGTREGILCQGGATAPGIVARGGATSGPAVSATALGGNSNGGEFVGNGSGHGVSATGGAGASGGGGAYAAAGAGSGQPGVEGVGDGAGAGVRATAGGTAGAPSLQGNGGPLTLNTNITNTGTPAANAQYADQITKAWARILTTGTPTSTAVVQGGVNISATIEQHGSNYYIKCAFLTAMGTAFYAVTFGTAFVPGPVGYVAPFLANGGPDSVPGPSASAFYIGLMTSADFSSWSQADPRSAVWDINLHVDGKQ